MKNIRNVFLLFIIFLASAYGDDTDERAVLRVNFQPCICTDCYAAYGIAEVGEDYWRLNGTGGFRWDNNRIKVSGEYLKAKNTYTFQHFDKKEWIGQGAVGVLYERMLCHPCFLGFSVGGTYSHADSKDVEYPEETFNHHISGSDAYALTVGGTMASFMNGLLYVYATYDNVEYKHKDHDAQKVDGIGAGFQLMQPISSCFDLVVKGDIRQPYNYIEGQLNWARNLGYGFRGAGIFASHVNGKSSLSDETRYGISISMAFGGGSGCCTSVNRCDPRARFCNLCEWVATPAVYQPRVLAIADRDCVPPELSGQSSLVVGPIGNNFDFSTYFVGENITYSLQNTPASDFSGSINPVTGVASWNDTSGQSRSFQVVATNECGSAVFTALIQLF